MLAGGYIALRVMRQNHTMVVSCYVNLLLMIVSLITVFFTSGMKFNFIFKISFGTWMLFLVSALLGISDQISKFMALKFSEASKLQKFAFLPNLWCLIIDIFILGIKFCFM